METHPYWGVETTFIMVSVGPPKAPFGVTDTIGQWCHFVLQAFWDFALQLNWHTGDGRSCIAQNLPQHHACIAELRYFMYVRARARVCVANLAFEPTAAHVLRRFHPRHVAASPLGPQSRDALCLRPCLTGLLCEGPPLGLSIALAHGGGHGSALMSLVGRFLAAARMDVGWRADSGTHLGQALCEPVVGVEARVHLVVNARL